MKLELARVYPKRVTSLGNAPKSVTIFSLTYLQYGKVGGEAGGIYYESDISGLGFCKHVAHKRAIAHTAARYNVA